MNEPTIRVGKYSFTRTRWVEILHEAQAGLQKNHNDHEAYEAIKAAGEALGQSPSDEAQLARIGGGAPEPIGVEIPQVMQGLKDAALDIPRGLLHAVGHPIKTMGQMTGIANIPNAVKEFQNPDANWASRLDALMRALPTNVGYAPEAQAMMDDENTGTREHTRHIGNVASLALMGLGGSKSPAPEGFSRFGEPPVMGPREVGPITPTVEPPGPMPKPTGPPAPIDANWSPVSNEVPPQQPQLMLPKPKAPVTEVPPDMGRVAGQKGVTFGEESPLSPAIQAQVKQLLGDITRNQPGPQSIELIANTGGRGLSAVGSKTPPAPPGPSFFAQLYGPSIREILDQQRAKMAQHTPESIQGTDTPPNVVGHIGAKSVEQPLQFDADGTQIPSPGGIKMPGSADFTLSKNPGPDVPMGPEAGYLGGKMGEAATIMFSPRLYLLLKRLNRSPADLIGASRTNAALGAVVKDLLTASILGQPQRIKALEDQISQMMQTNGTPQR